jgi:hypothetical protein
MGLDLRGGRENNEMLENQVTNHVEINVFSRIADRLLGSMTPI